MKEKPTGMRNAIIALIGTLLTACGGISGALITNAAAIYQLEAEQRRIALPASGGGETLQVDAGEVFLTRLEAAALDADSYYVNLEQGFVLHRPLEGWGQLETLTVGVQLAERGVMCTVVCDQPVYRLHHGGAVVLTSDAASTVNGAPLPADLLAASEALYGPPPWSVPFTNALILNIYEKEQVQPLGVNSLPDLLLMMTRYASGRVHRLVAPQGQDFALVQLTSTYGGILVDGQASQAWTVDGWMFFTETETAFYMIEITYAAGSGDPIQVWDDLQYYVDTFRVIREEGAQ